MMEASDLRKLDHPARFRGRVFGMHRLLFSGLHFALILHLSFASEDRLP